MEKNKHLIAAVIITVSALLGYYSLNTGHDWGGDFALYIRQAKSIVDGTEYECLVSNSRSMAGSSHGIGPDIYPWGFPLLLSPVYYLFGLDLFAMKVYLLFYFLLSMAAVYLLLKDKLDDAALLLTMAALAFSPALIKFQNNVLSEMPHLLFALVSVIFIEKTIVEKKFLVNRFVSFSITGALFFLSYFTHARGIILLPTFFACQIIYNWDALKRDVRVCLGENLWGILPYAVFFMLVFIAGRILPGGSSGSYLSLMPKTGIKTLFLNAIYYIVLPADFFGNGYVSWLLYAAVLPFLFKGFALISRKDYVFLVYSIFTTAIFIAWPYRQGLRLLVTLMPFYLYFIFRGLSASSRTIGLEFLKYGRIKIAHACGVFLAALFFIQSSAIVYRNISSGRKAAEGPFIPASIEMFDYVKRATSPKESFIFFKPRVFMLMTGRDAFAIDDFNRIVGSRKDYLIISKKIKAGRQLNADNNDLKANRDIFEPVFENTDFIVFRIKNRPRGEDNKNQDKRSGA